MKGIEIPFGAKDSELKGWEYTIPEGMEAEIKDGKIVVREKQPELTDLERAIKRGMLVASLEGVSTTIIKETAKEVKNIICKGCTVSIDSYIKGREDERKEAEKSYTFHYPTYEPPCHHGGICTNPFKDCINCPRTGGDIGISTTTSRTCKKD